MAQDTQDICRILQRVGVAFKLIHHQPEGQSDRIAKIRQQELGEFVMGAKALLCKCQGGFVVLVIPGQRTLDNKAVRKKIGPFRFATASEFGAQTDGLVPGTLPPFSNPIFPKIPRLIVDPLIFESGAIAFNAASLENSIVISSGSYLQALGFFGTKETYKMSKERA
jgi:Ala-tRNA(Pro) deacylase